MPAEKAEPGGPARARWLASAVAWWALAGGIVLAALVLVEIASLLVGVLSGSPIKGVFELTEMGVAIAAFAFLPYCQLTGAHVSADIFTSQAGPRTVAAFALLSAVIALAIGVVLAWRMALGLKDYWDYEEVTAILGIPIWWAFLPILASLLLLCAAALQSLIEAIHGSRS